MNAGFHCSIFFIYIKPGKLFAMKKTTKNEFLFRILGRTRDTSINENQVQKYLPIMISKCEHLQRKISHYF